MSLISNNLAALVTEIGTDNLRALPLSLVHAVPQDDDDEAVPIKLFFGCMRKSSAEPIQYRIWIYLFPAPSSKHSPELSFRSYQSKGDSFGFDADNIGRIAENISEAFKGMVTKEKLMALAKYYFLEKMAALQTPDDRLTYAIPFSAKFVTALRACCRECAEAKEKPQIAAKTRGVARVVSRQTSTRGSLGYRSQRSQRERRRLTRIPSMESRYAGISYFSFLRV